MKHTDETRKHNDIKAENTDIKDIKYLHISKKSGNFAEEKEQNNNSLKERTTK